MDISLVGQNIFIVCSIIAAVLCTIIVSRLRKRWYREPGLLLLAAAVLASLGIEELVHAQYRSDKLPTLFWLMTFPFTFSIGLVIASWHRATTTSTAESKLLSSSYTGSNDRSLESDLFGKNKLFDGQIKSVNIPGTLSHFAARTGYVYLPAIATAPIKVPLPVIVLSAGYPGMPGNWVDSGLADTMNAFSKIHHGVTPIVFMVDNTGSLTNDTECVNSPRGNVETYLTSDVPNYIKAHYSVSKNPSQWAIGGLSMGGMCSLMLTLRHPNVYRTFMDFGGESGPEVGNEQTTINTLFNGSQAAFNAHQPPLLLNQHTYKGLNGFFGIGDSDNPSLISAMKVVNELSLKAGIKTSFLQVGGAHTFNVWQELFADSLPSVSNRIGATEGPLPPRTQ
jgi:S-formylglutathione hydrolase FrmB